MDTKAEMVMLMGMCVVGLWLLSAPLEAPEQSVEWEHGCHAPPTFNETLPYTEHPERPCVVDVYTPCGECHV